MYERCMRGADVVILRTDVLRHGAGTLNLCTDDCIQARCG